MPYVVSIVVGYLLGCFQTSFIIGKTKKHIDIREHGSGNAGTTNAIRVFGWKFGLMTFIGDFLKAVLAVIVMRMLFADPVAGLIAGLGVIIGHNWPVFLKFKGGKGIASTIGMLMAVEWRMGLIAILIMVLVIGITKLVSLGSLVMAVSIPIGLFMFSEGQMIYLVVGLLLMAFAFFRHRQNIDRLLKGTENKLGHKKS